MTVPSRLTVLKPLPAIDIDRFLPDLRGDPDWPDIRRKPRLHRFIGVIYPPESERRSHHMPALAARQSDGWVRFDRIHALVASKDDQGQDGQGRDGAPDGWSFGV